MFTVHHIPIYSQVMHVADIDVIVPPCHSLGELQDTWATMAATGKDVYQVQVLMETSLVQGLNVAVSGRVVQPTLLTHTQHDFGMVRVGERVSTVRSTCMQ